MRGNALTSKRNRLLAGIALPLGLVGGLAFAVSSPGIAAIGDEDGAAVHSDPRYWVEEVISDLENPWAMAWLPNGDMLLTERVGRLRIIRDGKLLPDAVEGTPEVLTTSIFDGLLDIAVDPDFAENRNIYLTYTTGTEVERMGHIYKARLENGKLVDGREIYRNAVGAPAGGPNILRILFMPDKTMLVGEGSGGQGSRGMVQRKDLQSGKIIHLNRDGSAVANGPFAGEEGALPEIYAMGFRNPAGIARLEDGTLWAVDIGPKGGDELNQVKSGANYGWPQASWGFDYSGRAMSDKQDGQGIADPAWVWSPSTAPSGLMAYYGDKFPEWRGDLFTGELMGHQIRRMRIREGKVVLQESIAYHLNERIRDVEQGPDGYIYAITDSMSGRLLRIRPGKPDKSQMASVAEPFLVDADGISPEDFRKRGVYQEKFTQILFNFKYDAAKAKQLYASNCAACHSFGSFESGEIGPDLNGVYLRRSGSVPEYNFSAAMSKEETKVTWDDDSLVAFISNPQGYYPGTRMMSPPITDFEHALQIMTYLKKGGEASD